MTLAGIKIILVEPAGRMNVGSVARVMKNFGLSQLVLVNPKCDHLSEQAQHMAVHAKEILNRATVVASLPEALQGCKRAIATFGRDLSGEIQVDDARTALPWLLEPQEQPGALIFGREDRGLTNEELNYAHKLIRIPTSSDYPSLNLATAVAICCYELGQMTDLNFQSEKTPAKKTNPETQIASLEVVEQYYQELESLLLDIGFLYPHTVKSRMERLRQLYKRAHLQNRELSMLRGILRQVEWALGNKNNYENL